MENRKIKCAQDIRAENYKEKIIELVNKIESQKILKLIYGLVKSGYAEEKAGSA